MTRFQTDFFSLQFSIHQEYCYIFRMVITMVHYYPICLVVHHSKAAQICA